MHFTKESTCEPPALNIADQPLLSQPVNLPVLPVVTGGKHRLIRQDRRVFGLVELLHAAIVVFYFVLKKHSALPNKVLVEVTPRSLVCGGVTDHSLLSSRIELVVVIQSLAALGGGWRG